jgi:hypothetical protein
VSWSRVSLVVPAATANMAVRVPGALRVGKFRIPFPSIRGPYTNLTDDL